MCWCPRGHTASGDGCTKQCSHQSSITRRVPPYRASEPLGPECHPRPRADTTACGCGMRDAGCGVRGAGCMFYVTTRAAVVGGDGYRARCRPQTSRARSQSAAPQSQGLRHADENGGGGGDGDQAAAKPGFSSEGNPYQKPKTPRIWSTIFLKMGGIIPRTLKNGGTRPPVPPVAEPLPRAGVCV